MTMLGSEPPSAYSLPGPYGPPSGQMSRAPGSDRQVDVARNCTN